MLLPAPPLYPRRKKNRSPRKRPPGPAPLLTAATYVTATRVELTFDIPVDVSGLVPATVIVFDGPSSTAYAGVGAPTVISPTKFQLDVAELEPTGGSQVMLSIYDGNGILAIQSQRMLVGFVTLPLPYP